MQPHARHALAPAFSLYLDLLRAGSAIWVALSHLKLFGIAGPASRLPVPTDGHDAVVLFFILSGFLVAHAVQRKPSQGLRGYVLDRASRIYAVAMPLLLLSFGCAMAGLISTVPQYQLTHWYLYLPLFLGFLNQSLGYTEVPFLLYPWWSLAYEVWYYILFGCALFLRGVWRWLVCIGIFALMGPNLWLLLPVWLCGTIAAVWRVPAWSRATAGVIAVLSVILLLLFNLSDLDWQMRNIIMAPWGGARPRPFANASYFSTDYMTALLVTAHLVALRVLLTGDGQILPAAIRKAIRALAGVSFTLYLLHPLVYRLWTDALGRRAGDTLETVFVFALAMALAFALAPITEYRRLWWRRHGDFLLARLGWHNREKRA